MDSCKYQRRNFGRRPWKNLEAILLQKKLPNLKGEWIVLSESIYYRGFFFFFEGEIYFVSNLGEVALWTMGYILSTWLCKEHVFHWWVEVQFKSKKPFFFNTNSAEWLLISYLWSLGCGLIFHIPSWLFAVYSPFLPLPFAWSDPMWEPAAGNH